MDVNERMQSRLTLFSAHYKAKYGVSIGKIALGVGIECPNRRLGGCLYCSPASFTPFYLQEKDLVSEQLAKGKRYLSTRKFTKYLGYFQQETSTAGPEDVLLDHCLFVLSDPDCVGLIISTRPDYVSPSFLEALQAAIGSLVGPVKEILFELGLQSSHEKTLALLNRNHTCADFVEAAAQIKSFPLFGLGVHLILGLPGEDVEDMRQTVRLVSEVGVDAIKFHHLQVICGTKLQQMYEEEPFAVYSARQHMEIVADCITYVPRSVVLHRLWSSSARDMLVAPQWGGLGAHQLNGILLEICERDDLFQGKRVGQSTPQKKGVANE